MNFTDLETAERELYAAMRRVISAGAKKLCALDFLAWAAANRSLGLIAAFRQLLEARNYLTAAALVRLQLDTALRFMAAWHVPDPQEFASRVLHGERIDRLKDREGKRLLDKRLVDLATTDNPWVKSVYEATSGFIHLSDTHIFGACGAFEEGLTIQLKASPKDPDILPDSLRQEAIDGFTAAVRLVVYHLGEWEAGENAGRVQAPDA